VSNPAGIKSPGIYATKNEQFAAGFRRVQPWESIVVHGKFTAAFTTNDGSAVLRKMAIPADILYHYCIVKGYCISGEQ